MIIHDPGNHLLRIDALWAFISTDENGNEGLCAAPLPGFPVPMPLIAADEARLQSLTAWAELIAKNTGKTIKLIKLSTREEIREIRP